MREEDVRVGMRVLVRAADISRSWTGYGVVVALANYQLRGQGHAYVIRLDERSWSTAKTDPIGAYIVWREQYGERACSWDANYLTFITWAEPGQFKSLEVDL